MRGEETGKVRRVLGYARVSSREQALGTSLQDQQNVVKAYAAASGLEVARHFVEAESAVHEKFERREKMQQLMAELRSGDLVLCDKLDRWSRDPEFTYRSMREIREKGARVYFVGEQIDPTTPEGDSMLNMRVLMAREEHKRIKLRMVGTRKLLRNQGLYSEGLPPVGYRRQLAKGHRGADKNALLIDEHGAALVVEFFRLSAKGWSVDDILAHTRKKDSSRKWDKSRIHDILRNRIYLGEIKDARGVWIKGRHEPIIDAELFAKTQAGLAKRRLGGARPRSDSYTSRWLLRGLARCAKCGAPMGAAYGGGEPAGRGKERTYAYFYYRCTHDCGAKYVPVKAADEAVAQRVLARLIDLRRELAKAPAAPPKRSDTVDFALLRARLEQRRDRLLEARLDGHVERDEFNRRMAKLDLERTKIDAAESEHAKKSPLADPAERRAMLLAVSKLRDGWAAMDIDAQRATLADMVESVRLARGEAPAITWLAIEKMAEEVLFSN